MITVDIFRIPQLDPERRRRYHAVLLLLLQLGTLGPVVAGPAPDKGPGSGGKSKISPAHGSLPRPTKEEELQLDQEVLNQVLFKESGILGHDIVYGHLIWQTELNDIQFLFNALYDNLDQLDAQAKQQDPSAYDIYYQEKRRQTRSVRNSKHRRKRGSYLVRENARGEIIFDMDKVRHELSQQPPQVMGYVKDLLKEHHRLRTGEAPGKVPKTFCPSVVYNRKSEFINSSQETPGYLMYILEIENRIGQRRSAEKQATAAGSADRNDDPEGLFEPEALALVQESRPEATGVTPVSKIDVGSVVTQQPKELRRTFTIAELEKRKEALMRIPEEMRNQKQWEHVYSVLSAAIVDLQKGKGIGEWGIKELNQYSYAHEKYATLPPHSAEGTKYKFGIGSMLDIVNRYRRKIREIEQDWQNVRAPFKAGAAHDLPAKLQHQRRSAPAETLSEPQWAQEERAYFVSTTHEGMLPRFRRLVGILIGVGLAVAGGLVGSAFGILNMFQLAQLRAQLTDTAGKKFVITEIQKLSDKLAYLRADVTEMNATQHWLIENVAELLYQRELYRVEAHLQEVFSIIQREVDRRTDGLVCLLKNQLSPELINATYVAAALLDLSLEAKKRGYETIIDELVYVYQMPASFLVDSEGKLTVFVHCPLLAKGQYMKIWRLINVPMAINGSIHSIQLEPETDLIGVDEDETGFLLLSELTLRECTRYQNVYFCENNNFEYKSFSSFCVTSLYKHQNENANQLCPTSIVPPAPKVIQLDQQTYYVFQPENSSFIVKCPGQADRPMKWRGSRLIENMTDGCRGFGKGYDTASHADYSVNITLKLAESVWTVRQLTQNLPLPAIEVVVPTPPKQKVPLDDIVNRYWQVEQAQMGHPWSLDLFGNFFTTIGIILLIILLLFIFKKPILRALSRLINPKEEEPVRYHNNTRFPEYPSSHTNTGQPTRLLFSAAPSYGDATQTGQERLPGFGGLLLPARYGGPTAASAPTTGGAERAGERHHHRGPRDQHHGDPDEWHHGDHGGQQHGALRAGRSEGSLVDATPDEEAPRRASTGSLEAVVRNIKEELWTRAQEIAEDAEQKIREAASPAKKVYPKVHEAPYFSETRRLQEEEARAGSPFDPPDVPFGKVGRPRRK